MWVVVVRQVWGITFHMMEHGLVISADWEDEAAHDDSFSLGYSDFVSKWQ